MRDFVELLDKEPKDWFTTIHVEDQDFGEIPKDFARKWDAELETTWILFDSDCNTFPVTYNQNIEEPKMKMGWSELRTFYNMVGNKEVTLDYHGDSVFEVQVWDKQLSLSDFPRFHSMYPRADTSRTFMVSMTNYKATGSQLFLPSEFAAYVRQHNWRYLCLRGEWKLIVKCKLLIRKEPKNSVKIGEGWKSFCELNEVNENDMLRFEFATGDVNVIDVYKC